jgi:lysophospholipase L1-like esterase
MPAPAINAEKQDVQWSRPAVVTIMHGTNDSYVDPGKEQPRLSAEQYGANLRRIIKELRQAGITPVLMTPPRWGDAARNGKGENPNRLPVARWRTKRRRRWSITSPTG